MAQLTLKSSGDVIVQIGHRARALRLYRNLSQAALSRRADVALRTLQRFENTGRASIEVAVRVAFALGAQDAMDLLFQRPEPTSIDEFLAKKKPERRRVRGSK